jgi:hypothetical protein
MLVVAGGEKRCFGGKDCPRFLDLEPPDERFRFRRVALTTLVTALLALHAWLAWSATLAIGVSADEPAHLTAGYSYWRFNDYRFQPENGNLPQRWCGLPLLLLDPPPRLEPADDLALWRISHVWIVAQRFFFESGNPIDYLLLCARAAMTCWSVAAGWLVFAWSARLWGTGGGLLSLALFVLSPTTLAHGPLVTSDMCGAVWLLAAAGAWWRVSGEINGRNLFLSCLATGLAFVAKFSCVLLVPVYAILLLWRIALPEPIIATFGASSRRPLAARRSKMLALAGLMFVHGLAAWVTIWTFFGWRYSGFAPGLPEGWKYYLAWQKMLPDSGLYPWVVHHAREWHVLPEAYIEGFCHVVYQGSSRGAFLVGNYSSTGWWWFFPFAFLVKSTLAELASVLALAVAALAHWRVNWRRMAAALTRTAPLLVFALVYGASAMLSHLNIGQRHILPLYLVLFILIGALARRVRNLAGRLLIGAFVVLSIVESFSVRPDYLTFFNALAGGPSAGWRLLVDSSLDWGQKLPATADWIAQHRRPGEPVYLSYFGTDDPFYRGIDAIELSPYFTSGRERLWHELEPGLYCISATMLQDVYSPMNGAWTEQREFVYRKLLSTMREELAQGKRSRRLGESGEEPMNPLWLLDRLRFARLCLYLRARAPDAVVGNSVFMYRLGADEIRTAVNGTFTQLVDAIEAASATK